MEGLKRSLTGKYNARDVDRFILKIKTDYEECLREQKQRIMDLREEHKALTAIVQQYRSDVQYVSDAITQAEQTAQQIIDKAELQAMNCLAEAEARSHQMQAEARACIQRLLKLKKASESVYMAACKAVPDDSAAADASIRAAAQAVVSLCDSGRWQ